MEREKRVSVFVKLFVAFHALAITVWSIPNPSKAVVDGTAQPQGTDWVQQLNWKHLKQAPPLRAYMISGGMWQYWDMFAPNPSNTDLWGDAEVVYRDGKVKRFDYPRMRSLPLHVKYFRERFRKFFERASADAFPYLWGPFAQRVALEMDTMPDNPPVRVRLYRHWQVLPGPGKPLPEYQSYMYYEHLVDPEAPAHESTN